MAMSSQKISQLVLKVVQKLSKSWPTIVQKLSNNCPTIVQNCIWVRINKLFDICLTMFGQLFDMFKTCFGQFFGGRFLNNCWTIVFWELLANCMFLTLLVSIKERFFTSLGIDQLIAWSLNAQWALIERSLSAHWTVIERSLNTYWTFMAWSLNA